jgi:pimeloyl-ACP methyl ester carboxylesterase
MVTVREPEPGIAPVAREVGPIDSTRARQPDATGFIERDGVRVFWERYGDGSPTLLLMPTWSLLHSRHWKLQIPYFARLFRVVTFDGRGNGRSDRPTDPDAYADTEYVADALAVLDATDTEQVIVCGLSMGAGYALRLAAEHPERVRGAVFVGASVPILDRPEGGPEVQIDPSFDEPQADEGDWRNYNADYWRRDFPGFAAWFVGEKIFSEPHSTKAIEDSIGWTLETDRRVQCPALVIHGTDDLISRFAVGERLAAELGAPLIAIEGGGHSPLGRWPVLVNRAIRDFVRDLEVST